MGVAASAAGGGDGGRRRDGIGRRLRQMMDDVLKDNVPGDLLSIIESAGASGSETPAPLMAKPPPASPVAKRRATAEYRTLRLAMHRIEAGWRPL